MMMLSILDICLSLKVVYVLNVKVLFSKERTKIIKVINLYHFWNKAEKPAQVHPQKKTCVKLSTIQML